jgi:hypothetical protein
MFSLRYSLDGFKIAEPSWKTGVFEIKAIILKSLEKGTSDESL